MSARTINVDPDLARAEELGYICGIEAGAADAVRALAGAIAAVARPIWKWGNGHGGEVLRIVGEAAVAAGLDAPDLVHVVPSRVTLLAKRDGWLCGYCDTPLGWGHPSVTPPTVDHVVPRAQGGADTMDNLVLACGSCNSAKAARTPEQWRAAR